MGKRGKRRKTDIEVKGKNRERTNEERKGEKEKER